MAINGKQVQNREQFAYLRNQGEPTKLKLIAFKEGKYLEVEAVLTDPKNIFSVRTYVKP